MSRSEGDSTQPVFSVSQTMRPNQTDSSPGIGLHVTIRRVDVVRRCLSGQSVQLGVHKHHPATCTTLLSSLQTPDKFKNISQPDCAGNDGKQTERVRGGGGGPFGNSRPGAFRSHSISRVSRNGPRWFTAKCISWPCLDLVQGMLFTPAL